MTLFATLVVERAVPSEGSGENVSEARKTLDEAELSSEEDDTDAMERYANEKTGEVPESFFEILCRECTKIPYTPEEQQVGSLCHLVTRLSVV